MCNDIQLIALDLDGTLLNSKKELTPRCAQALARAAAKGIEIVPATGRFWGGMPQHIRALPFLHYAITINGAQVYDIRKDCAVAKQEIPVGQAIAILEYLDTLPVIYDCYMDNWGWMTRSHQQRAAAFAPTQHNLDMLLQLRQPVEELKDHLRTTGHDVQKIQFFLHDPPLRQQLLQSLETRFPDTVVSSSIVNNVEINNIHANKGEALEKLAASLGIPLEQTMAFGDGLNDIAMLRLAGVGVAMDNAEPEVKQAADRVTASCDEDGVAMVIETMLQNK